jgi:glyoxylase-like metal-dependent hydrolase (beta-lactamase superfamily II)
MLQMVERYVAARFWACGKPRMIVSVRPVFLKTPLPHQLYTAFQPDIMLGDADTMDLASFGVNGIVRRTAGHTPGSISVELSSHILVCTEKA